MKLNHLIIAAGLVLSLEAVGQKIAVTNAILYHREGKLDKAKEEIDKAVENEKTMGEAKTWYFKGLIYHSLYTSPLPAYQAIVKKDGLVQAADAYKKAMKLDAEQGEHYKNSKKNLDNFWVLFINEGVKAFQDTLPAKALNAFEYAAEMKPSDTTAYVYASFAAEQLGNVEKVKLNNAKLRTLGRSSVDMWRSSVRIYKNNKQFDQALAELAEARKEFPQDKSLAVEELSLYFQLGRQNEAIGKLEEAVKLDPKNDQLWAALGSLYDGIAAEPKTSAADKKSFKEKALANYRKAIEANPDNFESNYNLGAFHFNNAAEINKKIPTDINQYQKVGKKMEADVAEEMKRAIPFFENCHRTNPKDKDVIRSLYKIYGTLKMTDKAKQFEALMMAE